MTRERQLYKLGGGSKRGGRLRPMSFPLDTDTVSHGIQLAVAPVFLLTAVAGALAGAISMMAGEFVATKSQNEVMRGELKLERTHVDSYLDEELAELSDLLELIGLPPPSNDTANDDDDDHHQGQGWRDIEP